MRLWKKNKVEEEEEPSGGKENTLLIVASLADSDSVPDTPGNLRWGVARWINAIKTSQYEWWSFPFLNFIQQCIIPANAYFILMAALQLIKAISDSNGIPTYLMPLSFVMLVTMIKDGFEELKRHQSDREENNRACLILKGTDSDGSMLRCEWEKKRWKDLRVGDYVKVQNDESFPADIILLSTSDEFGIAYVETVQLDGETNMKTKTAIPEVATCYKDVDNRFPSTPLSLSYGPPSAKLYNFNGQLNVLKPKGRLGSEVAFRPARTQSTASVVHRSLSRLLSRQTTETNPLTQKYDTINTYGVSMQQFLWRGAKLVNTNWVIGIVVYTGHNTRIFKNTKGRTVKFSGLMRSYNYSSISLLGMQIGFCILAGILFLVDVHSVQSRAWYLMPEFSTVFSATASGDATGFAICFGQYLLLLSYFIPITLLVQLEIARWFHGYYIASDEASFSKANDTYPNVSTLSVLEDLGSITHVFSDKTGTLTQNIMQLAAFAVGAETFGFPSPGSPSTVASHEAGEPSPPTTLPPDPNEADETQTLYYQTQVNKKAKVEDLKPIEGKIDLSELDASLITSPNRNVHFNASNARLRLLKQLTADDRRNEIRAFLMVLSVCHSVLPKTTTVVERVLPFEKVNIGKKSEPSHPIYVSPSTNVTSGRRTDSDSSAEQRKSVTGLAPGSPTSGKRDTGSSIHSPNSSPRRSSEASLFASRRMSGATSEDELTAKQFQASARSLRSGSGSSNTASPQFLAPMSSRSPPSKIGKSGTPDFESEKICTPESPAPESSASNEAVEPRKVARPELDHGKLKDSVNSSLDSSADWMGTLKSDEPPKRPNDRRGKSSRRSYSDDSSEGVSVTREPSRTKRRRSSADGRHSVQITTKSDLLSTPRLSTPETIRGRPPAPATSFGAGSAVSARQDRPRASSPPTLPIKRADNGGRWDVYRAVREPEVILSVSQARTPTRLSSLFFPDAGNHPLRVRQVRSPMRRSVGGPPARIRDLRAPPIRPPVFYNDYLQHQAQMPENLGSEKHGAPRGSEPGAKESPAFIPTDSTRLRHQITGQFMKQSGALSPTGDIVGQSLSPPMSNPQVLSPAAPETEGAGGMSGIRWSGNIEANYDASSPDELALVAGAKHLGVEFLRRPDLNSVEVSVNSRNAMQLFLKAEEIEWFDQKVKTVPDPHTVFPTVVFDLIEVLDFDNFRKRMSVIIRDNDSTIMLLTKGADSSMLSAIDPRLEYKRADYERVLSSFAREGLRTLVLAYRILTPEELKEFQDRIGQLRSSGVDDVEKFAEVYSSVETKLTPVGCTAIDDKLQEEVPETIEALKDAGIRVWVLTGDKVETAISIGHSCNLLTETTYNAIVDGESEEAVREQLHSYMFYIVGAQLAKEAFDQILKQDDDNDNELLISCCRKMGCMGKKRRKGSYPEDEEEDTGCRCCRLVVCGGKRYGEKTEGRTQRGNSARTVGEDGRPLREMMSTEKFVNIIKMRAKSNKINLGKKNDRRLTAEEIDALVSVYLDKFDPERTVKTGFLPWSNKTTPNKNTGDRGAPQTADRSNPPSNLPPGKSPMDEDFVSRYNSVALTVTGDALNHALATQELRKHFFGLANLCSTVIACRVTPKQKAEVVRQCAICTPSQTFTSLGIGDGANDVGMILTANVGVGILGKEGSQAARSSDISIGEFKLLRNLLFGHGHIILRRHALMMYQTIFKNVLFAMASYFTGFLTGFSAADPYDSYLKQLYNLLLTPWPIMSLATFDRAIPYDILVRTSPLYPIATQPDGTQYFGAKWFGAWFSYGIFCSGLIVLIAFLFEWYSTSDAQLGYKVFDWPSFGSTVFGLVVIVAICVSIPYTHTVFWFTPLAFVICAASFYLPWLVCNYIVGHRLEASFTLLQGNYNWHFLVLLVSCACLSIIAIWWKYKAIFRPTPSVIIRERIKKGVFDIVIAPQRRGQLSVVVPRSRDKESWRGFAFAAQSESRFSLRRKSSMSISASASLEQAHGSRVIPPLGDIKEDEVL